MSEPKYFKASWEGMVNVLWGYITQFFKYSAKFSGHDVESSILIIDNETMEFGYDYAGLKDLGRKIIADIKKDNSKIDYRVTEYEKAKNNFLDFCKKLDGIDLRALDHNNYIKLYEELQISLNYFASIAFAEPISVVLGEMIEEELKNLNLNKDKILDYKNILSATWHKSFLDEEESDLVEIKSLANDKLVDERLDAHRDNYYWMQNSYLKAFNLDIDFFRKKMTELTSEDIKKHQLDREKEIKDNKKKILSELDSKTLKLYSRIADEFGYLHDNRKMYMQMYQNYLWKFIDEYAFRKNIAPKDVSYYKFEEIKENILLSDEELNQRKDICAMTYQRGKVAFETGDLARKWQADLLAQDKEIGELKGQIACSGKIVGIARVLNNSQEIERIKTGEILVASNTTPDYVPAMKKAAAFVTEKGGITSHAAIVSREMKKPCIVGVSGVTKRIKDGERVEVDADHGVVKILN